MKKRNRYFNGRWPIHSAIPLSNWKILPRKKKIGNIFGFGKRALIMASIYYEISPNIIPAN